MSYRDDWFEAERLHRAAEAGDLDEMERLVKSGFDVNRYDDMSFTPLHAAIVARQLEAAKWLLDHNADVNANEEEKIGETPLCEAVKCDSPELVALLLDYGADPDLPGWMGLTARARAKQKSDGAGHVILELLKSNDA